MIKTYVTALLLIFSSILSAQNFYVSPPPTGSNSNDGSTGSPWATVQHGLNQLTSGQVLNLRTGTYNEKIDIPTSGITLQKEAGQSPILDGTGLTSPTATAMIDIDAVSNITIDGIEIRNNVMNDAQGILVQNHCENISIQNCNIHSIHFSSNENEEATSTKNAQGIIVYGYDGANAITNLNILNNELSNCRLGYSEGIAVNGNVDGFEVSGNLVHNLTNIGIDAIGHEGTSSSSSTDQARNGVIKNNTVHHCISTYATSGGIYVDGGKSIIIENNTSYHNGYGVEIGCENLGKTTDAITIRNNLFYDNEVCALALGGFNYPTTTGKVINSTFRNNTCYKNDYKDDFIGEMYLSYSENCTIENNIFYARNQNVAMYHEGVALPGFSMNYNLYFSDNLGSGIEFTYMGTSYTGVSGFNTGTGFEANGLQINPLFVSPGVSNPDFHLQATSPAIAAGNPLFTPDPAEKDMDNEARVNGTVDCGSDEFYPPLAVTYLDALKARVIDNQIKLTWSTASEINSAYFEVERSANLTYWEKTGQLHAKNNTSSTSNYSTIDTNPLEGTSYYRLKQVDFDGRFSYSNIASVSLTKSDFSVSPNPSTGLLKLSFSKELGATIFVSDVAGKILFRKEVQGNQANLDLNGLSDGLYFISILTPHEKMTKRIVLRR